MNKLRKFIEEAGWPRILIAAFLVLLFIMAPFVQVRLDASISDTLVRFGMNGVMVLAMVPMIQSVAASTSPAAGHHCRSAGGRNQRAA